ncbi:toll/interleukin-1 receptor domain-containing protein [Agrobacterium sp. SOY23]|uniref:toll/interleukin-1 receptor domain-containing protein n=1 Tax=Agrobacterium sp. SOY23 TaxID=3014555 RepID=UPI0022AEAB25|nr:toll/interleukin-1 receptor domain-containing protein [Agrobacterium sp. SOY23]MCZ4433172.1 toll/interleukin-1 receptor domain-containing protein [Agrobacterium sp. SOY23]
MSKSVFVSHATKDVPLVAALVDLIEDGLGVPENEIFCSSLPGFGIPAGENFVSYMREQIFQPKVVVLVLSRNYFASHFCLSELGAAWVKGHKIFPVLVDPISYADVKDVLLGTQVIRVGNDIEYNWLRETLQAHGLATKSDTKWDIKRRAFVQKLPALLEELPSPDIVDPATHQAALDKLVQYQDELLRYEEQADQLKKQIALLEAAKDLEAVQVIRAQSTGTENLAKFDSLVNEIASMKYKIGGFEVFKFLLADHYDMHYSMDVRNYQDEYEEAALKKIVNLQDRSVNWDSARPARLRRLLKDLDGLLANDEVLQEIEMHYASKEVPFETDNLEFWQGFYGL